MPDVLLDTESLEFAFRTFLQPFIEPFVVEPFPDDFLEYLNTGFTNFDGAVLLTTRGLDMVAITESISAPKYVVDLYVLFRSAVQVDNKHSGGYPVLKAIVSNVHDKLLQVGTAPYKLKVITGRFVDQVNGVFVWAVRVEAKHKFMK